MSDNITVIYAAQTAQQAHMLKNVLVERGIKAIVTNDVLERGAGVDFIGWETLARVAVAEHDAEVAREIALAFEETLPRNSDETGHYPAGLDEVEGEPDFWPECPECGSRRTTLCPVCGTAGSNFPAADSDLASASMLSTPAQPSSCGCGSGGCSSDQHDEQVDEESAGPTDADAGFDVPDNLLMCTTCDEPFAPNYPRLCEWCGHEFADGYAVDPPSELEPVNSRTMAVIFVLAVLAVCLVAYFIAIV